MDIEESNIIKTVLIITIPRSGSSLLAGVLHRLGVKMGSEDDLNMGRHLNKYGCYEDQIFQSINLNILFESNILLDITNRLNINEDNLKSIVNKYEDKIKSFIENNQKKVWGFKDPALSYIIPYIDHLFLNPHYIYLKRDFKDTAGSLYKTSRSSYWIPEIKEKLPLFSNKNKIRILPRALKLLVSKNKSYKSKNVYYDVVVEGHKRIRDFIQNKDCLEIDLGNLITEPESIIKEITYFLKIKPDFQQIDNATKFIDPEILNKYQ